MRRRSHILRHFPSTLISVALASELPVVTERRHTRLTVTPELIVMASLPWILVSGSVKGISMLKGFQNDLHESITRKRKSRSVSR